MEKTTMERTTEVVIIGAGIVGMSIAYHLAAQGCRDVIVFEKEAAIGTGSTAKAAGGVRHQFCTEVNVKLSIESIKSYERFEDEIGCPVDFHRYGYLFLASTEAVMDDLQRRVALQRRFGIEVHLLSPGEAKELVPALNVDGLLGAAYGPTDGRVDPYSAVQGYASAARRLGVKVYTETEVTGINVSSDRRVLGVLSKKGETAARAVVNAAGPYARVVGKTAGLDIPVHPHKKQTFYTGPLDQIQRGAPYVSDLHAGFGIFKEGPGVGFSGTDYDQPEGFDLTIDWDFLPKLAERMAPRFPFLDEVGIRRADAGLHPDTPDLSAILGDVPEVEGLYLACGLNSQGIMHAPAVGRLMAEHILGKRSDSALSLLRLSRFKEGALQKEGGSRRSYKDLEETPHSGVLPHHPTLP
jgi:sarcosine oxidase subunit beta